MKSMNRAGYLLDVNVLIALVDEGHVHHAKVRAWLRAANQPWGTCAFTEAGFLRITTNHLTGVLTLEKAIQTLNDLAAHPRFHFWPIAASWPALAAPFSKRIFGHKQITDAYLLGLAVKEKGVLVTLDRGIRHMAGERYAGNVLVLE